MNLILDSSFILHRFRQSSLLRCDGRARHFLHKACLLQKCDPNFRSSEATSAALSLSTLQHLGYPRVDSLERASRLLLLFTVFPKLYYDYKMFRCACQLPQSQQKSTSKFRRALFCISITAMLDFSVPAALLSPIAGACFWSPFLRCRSLR